MPMPELAPLWPTLLLAGLAGLLLGGFFFGGLWWTVQRTLSAGPSVRLQLGSLVLRMAVTLLGFHAVGGGHWERLLACLLGFVVARAIVTRLVPAQEVRHAAQP
jgi:F1F0 ATPase subunit 2